MKPVAAFLLLLLPLTLCPGAFAQPMQCPECRAQYQYGRCTPAGLDWPPGRDIAFTGVVTAAKPIPCGHQITVNVTRSNVRMMANRTIAIDVAQCVVWSGALGDTITAAIFKTPQRRGLYTASNACGNVK